MKRPSEAGRRGYGSQFERLRRSGDGKAVVRKVYLHVRWLPGLAPAYPAVVAAARRALKAAASVGVRGDLVALSDDGISVLAYPGFWREREPALEASVRVDGRDRVGSPRRYDPSNAPVLHRKELTVPPAMRDPAWARRTADLERAGAFRDPARIGRRLAWREALRAAGRRP